MNSKLHQILLQNGLSYEDKSIDEDKSRGSKIFINGSHTLTVKEGINDNILAIGNQGTDIEHVIVGNIEGSTESLIVADHNNSILDATRACLEGKGYEVRVCNIKEVHLHAKDLFSGLRERKVALFIENCRYHKWRIDVPLYEGLRQLYDEVYENRELLQNRISVYLGSPAVTGNIKGFDEFLETARGHNVKFFMSVQDVSEIKTVYPHTWELIISAFPTWIVKGMLSANSADAVANRLSTNQAYKGALSKKVSITPEDVMFLDPKESLIISSRGFNIILGLQAASA